MEKRECTTPRNFIATAEKQLQNLNTAFFFFFKSLLAPLSQYCSLQSSHFISLSMMDLPSWNHYLLNQTLEGIQQIGSQAESNLILDCLKKATIREG